MKGGAHVTEAEGAETELRHGAVVPAVIEREEEDGYRGEGRRGWSRVVWAGKGKGRTTRK